MTTFLLFIAAVVFAVPLINAYSYSSLLGAVSYPHIARLTSVSLAAGAYYYYYGEYYRTQMAGLIWEILAYAACAWLVAMLLMFPLLLLLRVLGWFLPQGTLRLPARFVYLAAFLIGVAGMYSGQQIEREHLDLQYANLPAAWDGATFAFLADSHIGPYYSSAQLQSELRKARKEGATAVLIGGDLIDDLACLPELQTVLQAELPQFTDGAYFVWGNHEYIRNKQRIADMLATTPLQVLDDTAVRLDRNGAGLYLAGADYPMPPGSRGHDATRQTELIETALAAVPAGEFAVLMTHHPQGLRDGFDRGVPLILAGHTHGMQFGLFGQHLSPLYEFNRGLFRENASVGYVTRGTGHWFPFRFLCPREATYITLHRGA